MPDSITGTVIDGRYRVLSRLGSGGMADVFLAEDEQLGRKVALKLLHRRFAEDDAFVERFRREAQAAAGLQHPNIVGVYDRGSYDDTYYIAMEYQPGRSLKALIRQEAPLDPLRAIDITLQILKAARCGHRRGIIHRDLKPHNVIVDDTDHAKVTDFGIARAGASDMTETGSIMGTAQYLSPEQAQGHAVSAASDIYSIGVVLYELLTGRVPFDAESAVTIALKHVSEAPVAPSRLNPTVVPELEAIVMWALSKDPAQRPADAEAMIGALEQVRRQIIDGTGGQHTASMAAIPVPGPVAPLPEPVPVIEDNGFYPQPRHPRERNPWPWLLALLLILLAGGAAATYLLTRSDTVTVPPVIGEMVNIATAQLENKGFVPTVNNVTDAAVAGTVIRQSPVGGSSAAKGSTVTLTVSSGPGNVSIPPVDNLSEAQAIKLLRRAHLKVHPVSRSSQTIATGQAIGTNPPAGQPVLVGSSVDLFVSTGKPTGVVPPVIGKQLADARNALRGAGFKVAVSKSVTSGPAPGTVIDENPTGNTTQPLGSTISLTVAQAPKPAKVPRVTGMTASQASSILTQAGFQVHQQTRSVTDPTQDGVVLSQSPNANADAKKGSMVTITVGHLTPTSSTTTTTPPTTSTSGSTTTPTTTTTTG